MTAAPAVHPASLVAVLALGCATPLRSAIAPETPGPAGAADQVYRLLEGRFDSSDQARSSPGYSAIQVVACPAEVAGLGARALYLEQAQMETPRSPYRQRVYLVEPGEPAASAAVSRVFELASPGGAVGACDRPGPRRFARDELVERVGCAVSLRSEGSVFRGATTGRGCPSTLRGATYATSEVLLDAVGFRSWDRGFDASGAQKWGAEAGPYLFLRRTPPLR